MRRIVNIIVFAAALVVALLSVLFVGVYNDDESLYNQVGAIKEKSPEMIDEFLAVTPETLPQYVATVQEKAANLNAELKEQQLPKDILYTYISNLKEVDADNFEAFKADFPHYSSVLFAACDKKQEYIDGFNNVADFESLQRYITKLEDEYAPMRQDYLVEKNYVKSVNGLVGRATLVLDNVSASKQETKLAELQDAVKSCTKSAVLINCATGLLYALFFIAIGMMVCFAIFQLVKNFKTSYKVLIVIVAACAYILILYSVFTPEMTPSAIKMQHTVSELKWINAGIITCYTVFIGALVSIVATWIINLFKK
ncbi:MAG: hypothetical protein J6W84_07905 [Bacteroidales bacterium]|nr:hypothetical protein [Bacteroidales bacterium]